MPPCNVIPTRQADGAQAVKFNFFDAKRYFFIKAIKKYTVKYPATPAVDGRIYPLTAPSKKSLPRCLRARHTPNLTFVL